MRRAAAIALAALAAGPPRAEAQFRAEPMVIRLDPAATEMDVLAEPFATPSPPPASDALLVKPGRAASLRAHHALLAGIASPVQQPGAFSCVAAGRLAQNGGDAAPDVAYCTGISQVQIAFGNPAMPLQTYTHPLTTSGQSPRLTFARLHPPPRQTDVIVFPYNTGSGAAIGELHALDVDASAAPPALLSRTWGGVAVTRRVPLPDELLPMRLGATARSAGIDDLCVPGYGSLTLLLNSTPSTPSGALADLQLTAIKAGGTRAETNLDPADPVTGWLPPGMTETDITDVLGAGPLDVDFDGILDLVISFSPSFLFTSSTRPGRLLWIKGTANPADFATTRWADLTSHPDLQPLVDPAYARSLEIGGQPALAVFDRGGDAVLVITSDPVARRLEVWRGSAAGRHVQDLFLADLVGSPAPDLVAVGTKVIDAFHTPAPPAILVYPDLGDASPSLAWAPGSPGAPVRGEDHRMAISASDADGTFAVDWLVGDPSLGAPVLSEAGLAAGAPHLVEYLRPGGLLCGPEPQVLPVTVRATDDLGVFTEIAATLDVIVAPPALSLAGATPPGRLPLPPGGTTTTVEGSAWTRCADPVTFTWGGSLFAAAAGFVEEGGPTSTRRIVDLPEASYPALLASEPDVTLLAVDPGPGLTSPLATLPLDLDATGLVAVEHVTDRPALAEGDVAVLRTTLRSRIGVALPQVRVVDVLVGLAPAGSPRVTGAAVAGTSAGGAALVLDALPSAGAEVVIELPVRAIGPRGASAVEVRSSGDHLLTPPASAAGGAETLPGCGCGAAGSGLEAFAALALLASRRRRPMTSRSP